MPNRTPPDAARMSVRRIDSILDAGEIRRCVHPLLDRPNRARVRHGRVEIRERRTDEIVQRILDVGSRARCDGVNEYGD